MGGALCKYLQQYRVLALSFIILVVVLMLVCLPLVGSRALSATSIKFWGYVKDLNNNPIANSWVGFSDKSSYLGGTSTDEEGYYEFSVSEPGTYFISPQHNSTSEPYVYDYIQVTQTIETQQSTEIRLDFNLRPAGNIILHAYDSEGKLLRNSQFKTIANYNVYVTDLSDLPNLGYFHAVHDDYSAQANWSWDLAVPAFLVLPQTSNRIHVQWEVPEFGKIMLSADNEGQGYSVNEQGGGIVLNFNYEAAKSETAALQREYDLFRNQGYSISDSIGEDLRLSREYLATAELYLSQGPNPDMGKAVKELNTSLKLSLYAHERLLLERAEADIELYRKGNVTLKVLDEHGNPVTNGMVSFQQTTHDFLFGANPMGKQNKYDDRYADILRKAGINYSYIFCHWKYIEPSPGIFDWSLIDDYQNIQSQIDSGFDLMGGLALWFMRNDTWAGDMWCPNYQSNMTFTELKENIYQHMYRLASRYKGRIDAWQLNEPSLPWTNVLGLTWNQKLETYRIAANAVKDANTEAQVIFGSFALQYEGFLSRFEHDNLDEKAGGIPFSQFLDLATEQRIPFDIIGLEFYYAGVNTDGSELPGLDLVSVSNLFDQYAEFGKPIFVQEFSVPSTQSLNASWWHQPWDEATQAEYLKDFYTIAFSKPLVHEIGWSYGISDDDSFIISGGLLDEGLNPKPSYNALKELISLWTTSGMGNTDNEGLFAIHGFAGDYNVTIEGADGQIYKTQIHINEQQASEAIIEIPSQTPTLTPTPTTTPTPTSGSTATEEEPLNTLLIFGPILGVFGAGIIAYLVRRRLRTKQ